MPVAQSILTRTAAAAVLALAVSTVPSGADATPPQATPPLELTDFLAGPASPEDIVEVPGSGTAIVSGLSADPLSTDSVSHLYGVEAGSNAVTEIWPGRDWSVDWDRSRFPDCEGAPDPTIASPHGINIEQKADEVHELYVVNRAEQDQHGPAQG